MYNVSFRYNSNYMRESQRRRKDKSLMMAKFVNMQLNTVEKSVKLTQALYSSKLT